MRRLRAADQARGAGADPKFFDRGDRRLAQNRIGRQPEIIIRGKINQLAPNNPDLGSLWAADLAQLAMKRARVERLELFLEKFAHSRASGRANYIRRRPQESNAEASCQTPALLSPSTTTMMSRPGTVPLAMRQ